MRRLRDGDKRGSVLQSSWASEGLQLWADPGPAASVQTSAFSQESLLISQEGSQGQDGDLTRRWQEGDRKTKKERERGANPEFLFLPVLLLISKLEVEGISKTCA